MPKTLALFGLAVSSTATTVVLYGFTFAFWSLILQFLFVAEPFHTFHRSLLSNMN